MALISVIDHAFCISSWYMCWHHPSLISSPMNQHQTIADVMMCAVHTATTRCQSWFTVYNAISLKRQTCSYLGEERLEWFSHRMMKCGFCISEALLYCLVFWDKYRKFCLRKASHIVLHILQLCAPASDSVNCKFNASLCMFFFFVFFFCPLPH